MIKPSSGGFDMVEVFRDMFGNTHEYYRVRIKELEQLNDTIRNDYNEGLKRIKELESNLTTFIDETNRLTAIKKELEQELEHKNITIAEYIKGLKKSESDNRYYKQELERYKALKKKYCTACSFYAMFKKEFEEAKE